MKKVSIVLLGVIGFSLNLINSKAEILNRVEQSNGNISLSLHTDQGYMDAFEATIDVTGDVKIKGFEWNNNLDSMAVKKMSISENKKSLHLLVASKATNIVEQSKIISLGNLKVQSSKSSDYSVNLTEFSLSNLDMENITAKELVQQGKPSFTYTVKTENQPDDNDNQDENQNENEELPPTINDDPNQNPDEDNDDGNNNPVDNDNSQANQGETNDPSVNPDYSNKEENTNQNNDNLNNNSTSNNNAINSSNSNSNNNSSSNSSSNVSSGIIGSGVISTWQEQGTNYTYIEENDEQLEEDNKVENKDENDISSNDTNDLKEDEDKTNTNSKKELEPQEEHLFKINQKFILGALAIVGVVIIMIIIKIKKNNDY